MKAPKVSVIIPVYNCEEYIHEAICSVLNQGECPFEIEVLVCDDGSTDSSLLKINNYFGDNENVRIYQNDINRGKIFTVNRLLNKAEGEYSTILDSDDFFSPNKIKLQVSFLDSNPDYVFIGSSFFRVNEMGVICSKETISYDDSELRNQIRLGNSMALCCGSVLFSTSSALDVGGYNEYFHDKSGEDLDFFARMLFFGKGGSLTDPLYYYRFRKNSLTRRIFSTPEQRHSHDIIGFLFKQRESLGGKDSLNSEVDGLDEFIDSIYKNYLKSPGLMDRKKALDYAINGDLHMAFICCLKGFEFHFISSSLKTLFYIMVICIVPARWLLSLKSFFRIKNISKRL